MSEDLRDDIAYTDLGHGVRYTFAAWAPDRDLNPQYTHLPDVDRYMLLLEHDCNGRRVANGCTLDGDVSRELDADRPRWTVLGWEPLTLHPSILCLSCQMHGFVRDSQWIPA